MREKSVYEYTTDYDAPDGNKLKEHTAKHISGPPLEESERNVGVFNGDPAGWVELPGGSKVWRVRLRWEGSSNL